MSVAFLLRTTDLSSPSTTGFMYTWSSSKKKKLPRTNVAQQYQVGKTDMWLIL